MAPDELTYLDDPLEELLDGNIGRLKLRVLLQLMKLAFTRVRLETLKRLE